jgi:hypothetical protein
MEVFFVVLTESGMAKVAANPDNRWVTEQEILGGRCADSTRISPTMTRVLFEVSKGTAKS